MLPAAASDAQTTGAALPQPTLNQLVAEASKLSDQITSLGQQYDGLEIELSHAEAEEKVAKAAVSRDDVAVAKNQHAVAELAAGDFMNEGLDPTLQLLTSNNPQQFLGQVSIIQELDTEAGMELSTLQEAQLAAQRANLAASQQITQVTQLKSQMAGKLKQANAKIAVLDSSAMSQAMAVFQQTGSYPNYTLPLVSNVETIALRYALTKVGDPYVWGAAGPDAFDCSGLVVWAYAQEGISLPHYTGSLWNSGMHVSRDQLQPGDLVFFFADISHVGIYIGNGLMVDAPQTGQDVQVQSVFWDEYVGAVRI
ncbi:MAG TPA: NlpC/P60 family protein [Trebonia sp.]|jgi:cell wall-associated NlpC family hydrolase|nr:NlpC/P60 family protein [Trebonia sp.]